MSGAFHRALVVALLTLFGYVWSHSVIFNGILLREYTQLIYGLGLLGLTAIVFRMRRFLRPVNAWILFGAAITLRLSWVLIARTEPINDYAAYHHAAVQGANGGGILYADFYGGAIYFYSIIYKVFGPHPLAAQIVNAFLYSAQVPMVYRIARRFDCRREDAVFGALILTLWPEHIVYSAVVGSDPAFLFLSFSSLAALVCGITRGPALARMGLVFSGGLLIGMAQWVRPSAPFIFVALFAAAAMTKSPWAVKIRDLLVLTAGYAILLLALSLANYNAIGMAVPNVSRNGGSSFMFGTNSMSHGGFSKGDAMYVDFVSKRIRNQDYDPSSENGRVVRELQQRFHLKPSDETSVIREKLAFQIAVSRIKDNPFRFARMVAGHKIPNLWGRAAGMREAVDASRVHFLWKPLKRFSDAWQTAVLAWITVFLMCFGGGRGRGWSPQDACLVAILMVTLLHCFVESQSRYHHALLPWLCLLMIPWVPQKAEMRRGLG